MSALGRAGSGETSGIARFYPCLTVLLGPAQGSCFRHVSQIRKYETDVTQPSIEAVTKLALALSVPTDLLLFDHDERGPDDNFRLHFEALTRLDPEESQLIRGLIESVIVTHDVKRFGVASPAMARSA
ncbi:MAG TPA: helix-turn-helix transcriptional regulator [Acidimicrobiales bacterium]|nr:helix-turn-helix transcriptional regulator [Acidimicrobiales bacterium]